MKNKENIIGFILVALCWGFTNPFIKLGTKGVEEVEKKYTGWERTFRKTIWLLTRLQVTLYNYFIIYYRFEIMTK